MKQYDAAVVGLGRIGMGYDYDVIDERVVLTHASAYHYHPGFNLIGAVDVDAQQRARFDRKFGRPTFASVDELLDDTLPTIVSVATPTSEQASIVKTLIDHAVPAILCEKPFGTDRAVARELAELASTAGTRLIVNFIRRFEPGVRVMRRLLNEGHLGHVYKGVIWYSNGLINNGMHYIDLVTYLFGSNVDDITVIKSSGGAELPDPEPDFVLGIDGRRFYFLAGLDEHYSIGEFELVGTKGKLSYQDFGKSIAFIPVIADPVYPGYTILSTQRESIPNECDRYQWHVVDNIHQSLQDGAEGPSTASSAVTNWSIVDHIISLM